MQLASKREKAEAVSLLFKNKKPRTLLLPYSVGYYKPSLKASLYSRGGKLGLHLLMGGTAKKL